MAFSAVRHEAQEIFLFWSEEHLSFSIPVLLEGKFDYLNSILILKFCQIFQNYEYFSDRLKTRNLIC